MSIGQANVVPLCNEGLLTVVDHFKYLGTFCSANGTRKASAAFRELDKLWRDCNIKWTPKWNVLFTLLYACECWMDPHWERRGQTWCFWHALQCQHKILGVVWSQHIASSSETAHITAAIRKHCLGWFGYLQRMREADITWFLACS